MKVMKSGLRLLTVAVVALAVILCIGIYKKNRISGEWNKELQKQAEMESKNNTILVPINGKDDSEKNKTEANEKVTGGEMKKDASAKEKTPTVSSKITPSVEFIEEEEEKEQPVIAKKEPKATPYALAKENQPGAQEGWGRIKDTIKSSLTMKSLPQQEAETVRRDKEQNSTSVLVSSEMLLKLYGLYEGDREEVYRHVGVAYLENEYYGYILANRIEEISEEEAEASMPTPTLMPQWISTAVPAPTTRPATTKAPVPTMKPSATPMLTEKPKATATPLPTATPAPVYELVNKGYYDHNIIPDKFNTGCCDTSVFEKINSACVEDGVEYNMGDNGNTVVIDLYYRNKDMVNEVIIRNKDFSDKKFAIRHASMIDSEKVIRFENCMFKTLALDYTQDNVKYYFTNCSFQNAYGSNATFEQCFFGGSSSDGLNPYQNVVVKNCYFANYPQWNEQGIHTDAMQVYGKADVTAENIRFTNCRIEIPILERTGKRAINACFMVQLEYSNGRNFLFEDCIINGGGYSIYAHAVNGDWTMNNIVFRNISIGGGRLFGNLYPDIDENIVFDNLYDTEKLYVASVWKDSLGRIHLSVSNDTAEDRTLLVVTENGTQTFMIPSKATSVAAGAKEYYDLAIDMEIVPADAESSWVVCYDGEETEENQIRYVNWSGENVFREIQ